MSGSTKTPVNISLFLKDEKGWADFFITRIGLILFASILLLAAFKVYPMFQERENRAYLDTVASDIASKIEAVDSTTIPGFRYNYVFDTKDKNIEIEISTEFVVLSQNLSSDMWGEKKLVHAEPLIIHVYPPNTNWSNTSGFRKYISQEIGGGKNGDASSPLDLSIDKRKVDDLFNNTRSELSRAPFIPDKNKSLIMEKVVIYYKNGAETLGRDYVFVYQ